jgi:hypothetical protein
MPSGLDRLERHLKDGARASPGSDAERGTLMSTTRCFGSISATKPPWRVNRLEAPGRLALRSRPHVDWHGGARFTPYPAAAQGPTLPVAR